ncbi:MAG: enoyl-CoA hydratase/isomerase family protein [Jatrophihabitans sp.]
MPVLPGARLEPVTEASTRRAREAAAGSYQNFRVSVEDAIATVTIDRPSKRNALTVDMWRQLSAICADLDAETSLRAVVLTGAGQTFCAGADISALSADEASMREVVEHTERALRELAVPTIAKIRGHCLGGGNQLAIACDLRVADSTASFGVPPAKLGVIYPVPSTRSLIELVGPAWAKRLIFTAHPIDADTALRIGLVEQVVEPAGLDAAVEALLAAIRPLSPMTQLAAKQLVNLIADGAGADSAYESWLSEWRASPDGVEGPQAFLQRRPPEFGWRRQPPR